MRFTRQSRRRHNAGTGLLLCLAAAIAAVTQDAYAALIELPAAELEGRQALSWQQHTPQLHPGTAGLALPSGRHGARLAVTAAGVARVGGTGPSSKPPRNPAGGADGGLYAAIDAPFGTVDPALMDSSTPLGAGSESELWTLLLVGAGLIAYQIRRKSRVGSIRVRPL